MKEKKEKEKKKNVPYFSVDFPVVVKRTLQHFRLEFGNADLVVIVTPKTWTPATNQTTSLPWRGLFTP